jgi:hypothetical protein
MRPYIVNRLLRSGNDPAEADQVLTKPRPQPCGGIMVRNRKPDPLRAVLRQGILDAVPQLIRFIIETLRELLVSVQDESQAFEDGDRILRSQLPCTHIHVDARNECDNRLALKRESTRAQSPCRAYGLAPPVALVELHGSLGYRWQLSTGKPAQPDRHRRLRPA